MKHFAYTILVGMMAFGFVNCKENKSFELPDGPGPCWVCETISMEYFQGGGLPQPNVIDSFKLSFKFNSSDGGKVSVTASESECEATALFDRKVFDEIESLVSNSETTLGQYHILDAGDEKITLSGYCNGPSEITKVFFLREGDGSYNKPLLDEETSKNVRTKIYELADKVFATSSCQVKPHTKTIFIEENKNVSVPKSASISKVNVSDLQIEFKDANTAIINGINQTITKKQICTTQLKDVSINNADFVTAGGKVSILNSDIICEMALYYDPKLGSNYSPRSYTLFDVDKKPNSGNFGCMYANQIQNAEEFESILKTILKSQTETCVSR